MSDDDLATYYQSNTQFRAQEPTSADLAVFRQQYAFFFEDLDLSGSNVVEIGASHGVFLDLVKELSGGRTFFDELNNESLNVLSSAGHEPFSWTSTNVGCVVMLHVLEHLRDPYAYLVRLRETLSPGGRIAIEVPDHSIWDVGTTTDNFEHISYFSAHALSCLLTRAGFQVEKQETSLNPDYSAFNKRALRVRARCQDHSGSALTTRVARHFNAVIEDRRAALARIVESNARIGIYGTGMLTDLLLTSSPLEPGRVSGFFDGDQAKCGERYFESVIQAPADIVPSEIDTVLIVSSAENAIRQTLRQVGYTKTIVGWDALRERLTSQAGQ